MKRHLVILSMFLIVFSVSNLFGEEKTVTEPLKDVKKSEQKNQKQEGSEEQFLPHRDIKDLPIPYVMKLDKDNTYLIDVKGIKLGILTYKGRVDSYSLAENIKVNFAEEKWKLQSMQSYKNTVSLSFVKDERLCNVFIEEGLFTTRLEIRLSMINTN